VGTERVPLVSEREQGEDDESEEMDDELMNR